MSPQKPKRPSARPAGRQSSAPPPGDLPEFKLEIPKTAPLPERAASAAAGDGPARVEKKKLRVSARRGPSAGDGARAGVPTAPAVKAASRPKTRDAGTLPMPSKRVRAEAKPPAPAAASEPVQPHASGNGAGKLLEAEEPGDYSDDDIWHEADTGPSVHLYAAHEVEPLAASPRIAAAPEPVSDTQTGVAEPAGFTAPVSRLARSRRDGARDEAVMLGSAQTLVSTDYYFRQYGAHGMRSLSAEVDEFGLDPHVEQRARPWLEGLCKRYFRVDVDGVQNLPADGRVLMVCNRAGALPWDGLVLRTTVRMARPEMQPVRWLAEDSVFHYPFLGVFMNRLGAVRACPENAERLLKKDRLVAVFPEGAHGSTKLFKDRYRLQRFGRGGYVKLALKLGVPIVPTAIIGSEETNPVLARSRWLGRVLGAESLPITPTFPWLGAAGLLPAPIKWRIVVGEPIDLSSYGPKSADEALLVHRLNEQIRGILQQLVEQALGARRSALFG